MKTTRRVRWVMPIPSRFGTFYLEATERGLYALRFPSANRKGKISGLRSGKKELQKGAERLRRYLAGEAVSFSGLSFDLEGFTPFEKKILRALSKMDLGEVRSYADLARAAGSPRASRAVGSVMGKNRLPILLPCHRVVRADGSLGGYSKGLIWKRRLLALERHFI